MQIPCCGHCSHGTWSSAQRVGTHSVNACLSEGWMSGWTGGWMDGWMDGRMDGWAGGWMDEGVNRLSHLPPPSRHLHPFARGRRGTTAAMGFPRAVALPAGISARESGACTAESGLWCQTRLDSNPASATASLLELCSASASRKRGT